MMSAIPFVNKILADNVAHYIETRPNSNVFNRELRPIRCDHTPLEMRESGDNATLTKVYVTEIPDEALVLKPDNFNIHMFKSGKWNKACDYLILAHEDRNSYAFFIELKSSLNDKPDQNDSLLVLESKEDKGKARQFEGAVALFDYISMLVRKEYNNTELDDFQKCRLIIYDSIKPRSPMQSNIRLTSGHRNKSADIKTLQVHDAATICFSRLIAIFS